MNEKCAHCGAEAEWTVTNIKGGGYVRCKNMGCRMETPICDTEAQGWDVWNKRVRAQGE